MKLRVAIIDEDKAYAERLIHYTKNEYKNLLELSFFSDINVWEEYYQKNSYYIDLVLLDERLLTKVKNVDQLVLFTEKAHMDSYEGYPSVCKYQRIDAIYQRLLYLYAQMHPEMEITEKGKKETKIITFQSASGGVGVTTTAIAYSIYRVRQGDKVLYLNLENIGCSSLFFKGGGEFTFADVIYAIKSEDSNLSAKIRSFMRESKEHVFFFEAAPHALDIKLSDENVNTLFQSLRKLSMFDRIVVDYNFDLSQNSFRYLEIADEAYFVNRGDSVGNTKLVRAYAAIRQWEGQQNKRLLENVYTLYNMFHSRFGKQLDLEKIPTAGGFPWYEGENMGQIIEAMTFHSVFSRM